MNEIKTPPVELDQLLLLFFPEAPHEVGDFHESSASEIPDDANRLLNHSEHMTITVEEFHNSEVEVEVLRENDSDSRYYREILLKRKSDAGVVQFGIVRLDMSCFPDEVEAKIRERQIPLGRILISHNVMRAVKLAKLYRIESGPELAKHFGVELGATVYGRTAWMYCCGRPAIELLEIVKL